jgi:hypothetical protein
MTPQEVVQTFLDACEKEDWKQAEKFCDSSMSIDDIRKPFGGLKPGDVEVGEPVQAVQAEDGRWFVPLTRHFTKKHNLAMRKDNPAHRYVVDGGI